MTNSFHLSDSVRMPSPKSVVTLTCPDIVGESGLAWLGDQALEIWNGPAQARCENRYWYFGQSPI